MPRISTDNYDTVASWNGSQDLFVVEQPDGTKVATPAMVKQFIEAGDFEATGEVKDGHGNILKDMAKSADVATALAGKQDTLTFDDTPTASSNNPVKSGGVLSALNRKCSVTTYSWGIGDVTAGGVYELNNLKNKVGLSGKNIVAVGLVSVVGYGNYDYGASVFYVNDTAKLKTAITQSTTTARLYIIYTD